MFKLSDTADVAEYKANLGKECQLGQYTVKVGSYVRDTQTGSYEKGFKFHTRTIGYLEREEAFAEHYTRKLYSFDHGTTWNARLELARKAAGRKVITIHFNTRKEMAWGAIQDINRRYGF